MHLTLIWIYHREWKITARFFWFFSNLKEHHFWFLTLADKRNCLDSVYLEVRQEIHLIVNYCTVMMLVISFRSLETEGAAIPQQRKEMSNSCLGQNGALFCLALPKSLKWFSEIGREPLHSLPSFWAGKKTCLLWKWCCQNVVEFHALEMRKKEKRGGWELIWKSS